jgi:hypothetical protein
MSAGPAIRNMTSSNPAAALPEGARKSHALEGVSAFLRSHPAGRVLDFGGLNQQNLDYLTGLGHRLYSEDLLLAFDGHFSGDDLLASQMDILRLTRFLDETIDRAKGSAQVALLWDTLQFLPAQATEAVLDRLHRVLAPEGVLLAFFHADAPGRSPAPQSCRILDDSHILFRPRPARPAVRGYNPRTIEKCFQHFSSVKFYLSRENLQEVLVRR